MKRIFAVLMAAVIVCLAGCSDTGTAAKSKDVQLPTEVSAPGTMKSDTLLAMVNKLMENDENTDGFHLDKADGDSFEVPVSADEKQTLYLFQIEDLEIAIFADKENDCVAGVYVRSLFGDSMVEAYMASFAGAILSVLEPNEYENMLYAVLPAGDGDGSSEASPDDTKTASGEAWSIYYNENIVNILPAAEE